jgi:hypothetical protein
MNAPLTKLSSLLAGTCQPRRANSLQCRCRAVPGARLVPGLLFLPKIRRVNSRLSARLSRGADIGDERRSPPQQAIAQDLTSR